MKFFQVAAVVMASSLVEKRFEEAERRIRAEHLSPAHKDYPNPVANYATGGRVPPGMVPQIASNCSWIHSKPPSHLFDTLAMQKGKCQRKSEDTLAIKLCCYKDSEGFWWGENIISPVYEKCSRPQCLLKRRISIAIHQLSHHSLNYSLTDAEVYRFTSPAPPPHLSTHLSLLDEITINVILPQSGRGAIWFKPLLWFSSARCYSITLANGSSTTEFRTITAISPLKTHDGLEGISGFEPL